MGTYIYIQEYFICFLNGLNHDILVLWLNVDKPTGVWRLHKESCLFCKPIETKFKGVNKWKRQGGWFKMTSLTSAYEFFLDSRENMDYWGPCKICLSEQPNVGQFISF